MNNNYTQEADDALAAVMGETEQAAHDVDLRVVDDVDPFTDVTPVAAGDTAVEPLCDEDTARGLVRQVRDALAQFDHGIQEIIRLRAWEPLGYDNPREFVLAEFGPTDDPDAEGRVSRVHAYRLARLAMFMYGLATRLGDEAAALDISERALRSSHPAGRNGENDLVVLDRLEARMSEIDGPATKEETEKALGDVLSAARAEIAEHGSLRKDDTSDGAWDGEGFDDDRLADLGVDPADLVDDPTSLPEDTPADGFTGAEDSNPADDPEGAPAKETQGASRNDLGAAYGSTESSEEAIEHTQRLGQLLTGMQAVADIADLLPQIVDYADEKELDNLTELAARVHEVAAELVKVAEESGDLLTDGDF